MKRIVILGCENSHANSFLTHIKERDELSDVEVVGVYSADTEAMQKLRDAFGVPTMDHFDDAVGKVDGVVVTARHGKHHLEYVRPYLDSVSAVFIDKPFTIDEDEAVTLARLCKKHGVRLSGGSMLKFASIVKEARERVASGAKGKTLGAEVRAPVSLQNDYGDFFFYSQHLVEMVGEAFGRYPTAVAAFPTDGVITVAFRYPEYTVTGRFTEKNYVYAITHELWDGPVTSVMPSDELGRCSYEEFATFARLLRGGEQEEPLESFVAPVFILNAIDRSLASGKEEPVRRFTL